MDMLEKHHAGRPKVPSSNSPNQRHSPSVGGADGPAGTGPTPFATLRATNNSLNPPLSFPPFAGKKREMRSKCYFFRLSKRRHDAKYMDSQQKHTSSEKAG